MSALVFVGELNPYGADPFFALYHLPRNASGNRLREILGLSDVEYSTITKVNLCTGKWSMPKARQEAADLLLTQFGGAIVALGSKVRDAFGGPAFFETQQRAGTTLISLPHPSGLNRMWDAPGSRERARALLADHLVGARAAAEVSP